MASNPLHLSLFELYTAFRSGNMTAGDLTEQAIEQHNTALGAYKYWQPQDARNAAARTDASFSAGEDHGLLQGIPVSVKDLYNVDGLQTFAGSPASIPDSMMTQGPVVTGLNRQQAVFIGKTHTVEFAYGGLGVNSHWGTPRNPWDSAEHRVPGGSSSGAGVSLQEGTALLALGSDTAGSVRIPASMTGNVGLKTSFGRWSLEGIFPLSPTLDTAGILTRTVADAVFGFAAMDPEHQGHALEFIDQASHCTTGDFVIGRGDSILWEECDPGIVESVEAALNELSQKGVRMTDAHLPEVSAAIELLNVGNVTAAEIYELLSTKMPEWLDMLDPLVSQRILGGASMSATEYLKRRRHINQLQLSANARFESTDVIVSPTVAITPPRLDDVQQVDHYGPLNLMSLRNTCSGNTLGLCALTLPVGLDNAGLPVGLQVMARHGAEEKLLAIALCIEKVIGTSKDRLGTPAISPL